MTRHLRMSKVRSGILTLLLLLAAPFAAAQSTVVVYEFYHAQLGHYFRTASLDEAVAVDNGAAGPGWVRTADNFFAYPVGSIPPGAVPVCRFYGSVSPGPNSHFFTANAGDCEYLKYLQSITPATQKRWNYEGLAFGIVADSAGTCPSGFIPIYRLYNNGFARGADSNHRFTTLLAEYDRMRSAGWGGEGVVMCSPPATTLRPNLTPYKPSGWSDMIVASTSSTSTTDATTIQPGNTVYVSWAVANRGNAATAARNWTNLYLDGVLVDSWFDDPPTNPNFYFSVVGYSIGTLSAGVHTLRLVADADNAIGESDETDNAYTKTVTVAAPQLTGIVSWQVGNHCNNGTRVDYRFHDLQNRWAWPSSTTTYGIGFGETQTARLACTPGSSVCLGGRSATFTWGVGLAGSASCTDCCATCDNRTYTYNFGCGTPTTPPPGSCTTNIGTLNISADMHAFIYLNNQLYGVGQVIRQLTAGTYVLSVRDGTGRQCYTHEVFVTACKVNEYRSNQYCRAW